MSRKVRDLLVSWGGTVRCGNIEEVCRWVPLCLMLCIWRGQNDRFFEDVETSWIELQRIMFNMLYT
jgi:hypothetical protein